MLDFYPDFIVTDQLWAIRARGQIEGSPLRTFFPRRGIKWIEESFISGRQISSKIRIADLIVVGVYSVRFFVYDASSWNLIDTGIPEWCVYSFDN